MNASFHSRPFRFAFWKTPLTKNCSFNTFPNFHQLSGFEWMYIRWSQLSPVTYLNHCSCSSNDFHSYSVRSFVNSLKFWVGVSTVGVSSLILLVLKASLNVLLIFSVVLMLDPAFSAAVTTSVQQETTKTRNKIVVGAERHEDTSDLADILHTYIHTYIHTHIHTYIYTYIHTHIHTYLQTYIHSYIHTWHTYYIHKSLDNGNGALWLAPSQLGSQLISYV